MSSIDFSTAECFEKFHQIGRNIKKKSRIFLHNLQKVNTEIITTQIDSTELMQSSIYVLSFIQSG